MMKSDTQGGNYKKTSKSRLTQLLKSQITDVDVKPVNKTSKSPEKLPQLRKKIKAERNEFKNGTRTKTKDTAISKNEAIDNKVNTQKKSNGLELERLFNDITSNRSKFSLNPEFNSKIELYTQYHFYIENLKKALIGIRHGSATPFSTDNDASRPFENLATALTKATNALGSSSNMQRMITISREMDQIQTNYCKRLSKTFTDLSDFTEREKQLIAEDQESLKLLLVELNTLRQMIAAKTNVKEVEQKGKQYEDKLRDFDMIAARIADRCNSMHDRQYIVDRLIHQYLKDERRRYKEITKTIFTHPVK